MVSPSPPPSALSETPSAAEPTPHSNDAEKETLESHQVIELQAFSKYKVWIEEKIKFLEQLPPVQVFVAIDAIRASADPVPGLPSREQLRDWLAEHDRIEKEIEIFDSGELKKLRKFTKATTPRRLSREDTDLIELTLTTIYELDKLLHLLRDRSENLDLLGVRLSWEEHRTAAWADLKELLADIETFLGTRARWSSSVYEVMAKPEERPSPHSGSTASMASDTSTTYGAGFSRTARFSLAESLSRNAAQFAGKTSSLRDGNIAAAGKALDRLIDNSRKPVPEELLDEQDRLEEKGIHEMENVGKFVMDIVRQWREADELYVETVKDQSVAQNLLEEIESAKLYDPTPQQSSSFSSRVDTLVKRLALRGDPMTSPSIFPQPTHSLFPDQLIFNNALVESLSTEITTAVYLVTKVDTLAKEYHGALPEDPDEPGTVAPASQIEDDASDLLNTELPSSKPPQTQFDYDEAPSSAHSTDAPEDEGLPSSSLAVPQSPNVAPVASSSKVSPDGRIDATQSSQRFSAFTKWIPIKKGRAPALNKPNLASGSQDVNAVARSPQPHPQSRPRIDKGPSRIAEGKRQRRVVWTSSAPKKSKAAAEPNKGTSGGGSQGGQGAMDSKEDTSQSRQDAAGPREGAPNSGRDTEEESPVGLFR